jgi:hypothetical protein
MPWYRLLLILVTGVSVFLLAGALRGPAARPELPRPAQPEAIRGVESARADARATAQVERALVQFQDPGRQWLQASVWLCSHLPGLSYRGEGIYLRGAGQRYRVEVRIRSDQIRRGRSSAITWLAVSDGRDRWQTTQKDGTDTYQDIKHLRLGENPSPADSLLSGLDTLLFGLHGHLIWVRQEQHDQDTIITGTWQPHLRPVLAPADQPWPAALPRACRLMLRGADNWPGRIEWWGPATEDGRDQLLLEIEYRDPVWGQKRTDEENDRLFSIKGPRSAP